MLPLSQIGKRFLRTRPITPFHPDSHSTRSTIYLRAINHLHRLDARVHAKLRSRLLVDQASLVLLQCNREYISVARRVIDALKGGLSFKQTELVDLWKQAADSTEVILSLLIMRMARFANAPNRAAANRQMVVCIAQRGPMQLYKRQVRPVDLIAHACQAGICYLDRGTVNAFIGHAKRIDDVVELLQYAQVVHKVDVETCQAGLGKRLVELLDGSELVWQQAVNLCLKDAKANAESFRKLIDAAPTEGARSALQAKLNKALPQQQQ